MTDQSKNSPVEVLRDGALKAAIWKNESEKGSFFSVTLSKTFEQNGAPRDGYSFTQTDLLKVSELSRRTYAQVSKHRSALKQAQVKEPGEVPNEDSATAPMPN